MRVSALEEYGLRCLIALAKEGSNGQLSIAEIAEKEGLSIPYASKLLAILRKADLVSAVRGRGGGFCIAREPSEITLFEAITALGGPLIEDDHCKKFSGQLDNCIHTDNCTVQYTLAGLAKIVGDFLNNKTIQDMLTTPFEDQSTYQTKFPVDLENMTKELNQALLEPEDK